MLGKCWFSQFVLQIKCCQKILYSSIIAWSHRHLTFADLFFWLRTAISLDWCHRNIRGSKMSLPNVLYGVKWTWRLWNAYEIRGLHSVCCSAFCMAPCTCVCHPGLVLLTVQPSSRARRRAGSPFRSNWATQSGSLWIVWLVGWR